MFASAEARREMNLTIQERSLKVGLSEISSAGELPSRAPVDRSQTRCKQQPGSRLGDNSSRAAAATARAYFFLFPTDIASAIVPGAFFLDRSAKAHRQRRGRDRHPVTSDKGIVQAERTHRSKAGGFRTVEQRRLECHGRSIRRRSISGTKRFIELLHRRLNRRSFLLGLFLN